MSPTSTPTPKPSSPPSITRTAGISPDVLANLHVLLSRLVAQTPSQSSYSGQEPLEIQHLATEASAVKNRIQKTREKVAALPDVERTLAEQETEIQELQVRIEAQTKVLRSLGLPRPDSDSQMKDGS